MNINSQCRIHTLVVVISLVLSGQYLHASNTDTSKTPLEVFVVTEESTLVSTPKPVQQAQSTENFTTVTEAATKESQSGTDTSEDNNNAAGTLADSSLHQNTISLELDGILALETERFTTDDHEEQTTSHNGVDLFQLRANAILNLTDVSSVKAKIHNKPVDFPDSNEIFYFDTQDTYMSLLFYNFASDDFRIELGKISAGPGFTGHTGTYYGNQITSKDYDEKIGINYFNDFTFGRYNVDYVLSAFFDDTTRLSSSLLGRRERNVMEDDIPGRTDKPNNLLAGLSFPLGGSDAIYLTHVARSTQGELLKNHDTWLGYSKTVHEGENLSVELTGDMIYRDIQLNSNSHDFSVSTGISLSGDRSAISLSLEAERSTSLGDTTAKFAELIAVYNFAKKFSIEAAFKREDFGTQSTNAFGLALIYNFDFSTASD